MRPYRTITSRCLLQSCRLTDAQTGFFSAGRDGEPAGRAGSSGATGAQGNPGSHFTHADSQMRPHTHTCMHVYIAAHSVHLPCAVPQHNMLVLVYSFLTVCCNGCGACCPTRGIRLFIRHAVVSLCLSLAPPRDASNHSGSSCAVGYTFRGMLPWCQWELIDKSRSLSQLPMSVPMFVSRQKTIGMEWETDRDDEYPALMNRSVRGEIRLLSVFEHICLWTRPHEGHITDRAWGV